MYHITATIEGIAPLLFNRFTAEAQEKMDNKQTGGTRTVAQKKAEALTKVYRNGHGMFVPAANVKKALIQGAQKSSLKYGKKALWPFIEATVFFTEQELLLGKDEPDFVDERTGRIPPKTGARVVIRRPGVNTGWKLTFGLLVTDDRIAQDDIKKSLEEAGLLSGICDNRPEFGRFIVKEWKVA